MEMFFLKWYITINKICGTKDASMKRYCEIHDTEPDFLNVMFCHDSGTKAHTRLATVQ